MKRLKFALAGLGRIGKIHLDNLLQMNSIKVVAAMDPVEESRKYAEEKGVLNVTSTYEEMLSSTDIDVVVVCSPTDTHADYVEIAAKMGKHIFCEKPLDLSLQRVVEVLEVVEGSGVKLMIGFNRRFDKEFKKVKALVTEGAIGDHHLVKITSRDPGAPPVSYIEKSGGLFLDMTIHDFDIARFIVSKEVDEVYARGAVLVNPAIGDVGDIDTAVITLTYTDGTMAIIDNSREAAYGYDQRVEVFGSKGMVKAENNLHDSHQLFTSQGSQGSLPLHFFLERYAEAYKTEMSDYIKSLKNGTEVPASGNDGLQSLKIGLAAIKSLKENRPVKLSEINQFQKIQMLK
ncbi:inositol 2-dehydrogenase [Aestuariivivens sp. NBU2969]|uniref:inositol 2-dehydrogenase n=1 Tax=Aestuariivivens sp. NBU2969 TaxID=2873267 RepID=UPI001CBF4412|nr:inositol 2-dehydrogenase [Aestuariivivens sp. NBU2969]